MGVDASGADRGVQFHRDTFPASTLALERVRYQSTGGRALSAIGNERLRVVRAAGNNCAVQRGWHNLYRTSLFGGVMTTLTLQQFKTGECKRTLDHFVSFTGL